MERNTQELDCVSIPAITCYHHDKLSALSLTLGKLILRLEYQGILTILGMQQICDCKRTREMLKRSSATEFYPQCRVVRCWGGAQQRKLAAPCAVNTTHITLIPSRANHYKALLQASGAALQLS